jgi:hypothetical protein
MLLRRLASEARFISSRRLDQSTRDTTRRFLFEAPGILCLFHTAALRGRFAVVSFMQLIQSTFIARDTPPSMPSFTAVGECPPMLQCSICLEPWTDAVEVVPCEHIFCRQCVAASRQCPLCRGGIAGLIQPNPILCNMAARALMQCRSCPWQGPRSHTAAHKCDHSGDVLYAASQTQGMALGLGASDASNFGFEPEAEEEPTHAAGAVVIADEGERPWREYNMTRVRYEEFRGAFTRVDLMRSGTIDRWQVGTLMRELDYAQKDSDIDRMFALMDTGKAGRLTFEMFCTWLRYNCPKQQRARVAPPASATAAAASAPTGPPRPSYYSPSLGDGVSTAAAPTLAGVHLGADAPSLRTGDGHTACDNVGVMQGLPSVADIAAQYAMPTF